MRGPKLNSTVSVVKINENLIEFFKTNTRSQIRIKVNNNTIYELVNSLDGEKSVDEIAESFSTTPEEVERLVLFLEKRGLLDTTFPRDDFIQYEQFRRTIHFVEEYAISHEDLVEMWNSIRNAGVLIIGLGAVGSWVACNLVQSGVTKIYLMDADKVDETNLHRQFGYRYSDIGCYKVDALERRLKEYNKDINIFKCYEFLNSENLDTFNEMQLNLIINCADKPNVDTTSLWVGKYGMQKRIPHIIGGGYNLHLSLIGQTVIPGKSACVNCFKKTLEEENTIDPEKVRKLMVKNRKVGSFGPMCAIVASMIGMESIKILSGKIPPSNINRRGEFNIYSMDIKYKEYGRRDDCEWCGKEGKYFCN